MVFVEVQNREKQTRRMPLDAEPSPKGRWFINENEGDGSRDSPHTARYVGDRDPDFRKLHDANLLHTPHHATCPYADQFRGKKT